MAQLLRDKYDTQLELLRELMELSEEANRKIVEQIKREVRGG